MASFFLCYGFLGVMQPYVSSLFDDVLHDATWTRLGTAAALLLVGAVPPATQAIGRRLAWSSRRQLQLAAAVAAAVAPCTLWASNKQHPAFFCVALLLLYAAQAPLAALLDGFALTLAQRPKVSFGSIRLSGSMGFVVLAFAMGQLRPSTDLLLAVASALLVLLAPLTLCMPKIPDAPPAPPQDDDEAPRPAPWRMRVVLAAVALQATGWGPYAYAYTPLARQAGLGPSTIGTAWSLAVATEMACFALGPSLLNRLGAWRMCLLGQICGIARWSLLAAVPTPAVLIGSQLLHGPAFGWFAIGVMGALPKLCSGRRMMSAQTWFTSFFNGLSPAIGLLVASFAFQSAALPTVFWPAAVASAASLGLIAVAKSSHP